MGVKEKMATRETNQDEYADDYRGPPEPPMDYPKNPKTPAPSVQVNQDEAMFTGTGIGVEPPEIGEFPTAPLTEKGTKEHEGAPNGTDEDAQES